MPTKRQVRKKLSDMGVEAKYLAGQDGQLSPVKSTLKGAAWTDNEDSVNLRPSELVKASELTKASELVGGAATTPEELPELSETHVLGLLASGKSPYPPEKILEIMTRYVTLGSYEKAVEGTGVSPETVKSWKRQSWWPTVYQYASRTVDTRLEGYMTSIMENAIGQIQERLLNGDHLVHQGKLTGQRKPLDIADLGRIFGIMFDKRQLSRGLSAISGSPVNQMDKLETIAKRLETAIDKRFGITLDATYTREGTRSRTTLGASDNQED